MTQILQAKTYLDEYLYINMNKINMKNIFIQERWSHIFFKKIATNLNCIETYNLTKNEEVLVQRVVKLILQILYDKGVFESFSNADKVLKVFFCLLLEVELI